MYPRLLHRSPLTVFPRIIARGDYFFFRIERGRLLESRRLFQIFLKGGRALNIYFIIPLNQKPNHIKNKPNMGLLSVSNLFR